MAFHIDPNSGPRSCSIPERCLWASPEEHYATAREAQAAYESIMEPNLFVPFRKMPNGKHVREVLTPL